MLVGDTVAVDIPIYGLAVTVVGGGRVPSGVARNFAGGCRLGFCLSVGLAVDWLDASRSFCTSVFILCIVGMIVYLWAYASVNMSVYRYVRM